MAKLVLPSTSAPGRYPQEDDGRLINIMAEQQPHKDKVILGTVPGLLRALDIVNHSNTRGLFAADTVLYAVLNSRVYSIVVTAGNYVATNAGALSGTLPVTIARNNNSPKNIVTVTENGAFNLFASSPPTSVTTPAVPNSISVLNGYFLITIADGRIFASNLNSTTFDALSVEATNAPLVRGVVHGSEFFAFGQAKCRVYQDRGLSPFPLQLVTTINRGIVGTHAIAGWEENWASKLIWVADDNRVYLKAENSYEPQRISNHAQERMIEQLGSERANLVANVYMSEGHAIWSLSCDEWTWEYNDTTGQWHERRSYGLDRWRVSRTCYCFNKWICGEKDGTLLFELDAGTYAEDVNPIVGRVDSRNFVDFPSGAIIGQLKALFTGAVGIGDGAIPMERTPRVSISWAKDGGYYWSIPVQREIGRQGEIREVSVNGLGMMKPAGFKARIEFSAKTRFALREIAVAAEPRG